MTQIPLNPSRQQVRFLRSQNQRSLILSLVLLVCILGFWELGARLHLFSQLMPSASETLKDFWGWISDPFFDEGPNDKGIG